MVKSNTDTFYFLKLAGEYLRISVIGNILIYLMTIFTLFLANAFNSWFLVLFSLFLSIIGNLVIFIFSIFFLFNLKKAKDLQSGLTLGISFTIFVFSLIIEAISIVPQETHRMNIILAVSALILEIIGYGCLYKYAVDNDVKNSIFHWGFVGYAVFSILFLISSEVESYYQTDLTIVSVFANIFSLITIIAKILLASGIIKAFSSPEDLDSYPSGNLINNQEYFEHQEP